MTTTTSESMRAIVSRPILDPVSLLANRLMNAARRAEVLSPKCFEGSRSHALGDLGISAVPGFENEMLYTALEAALDARNKGLLTGRLRTSDGLPLGVSRSIQDVFRFLGHQLSWQTEQIGNWLEARIASFHTEPSLSVLARDSEFQCQRFCGQLLCLEQLIALDAVGKERCDELKVKLASWSRHRAFKEMSALGVLCHALG